MTIIDALKRTWARACEEAGIPPESKFVEFGPNPGPAVQEHDTLLRCHVALQRIVASVRRYRNTGNPQDRERIDRAIANAEDVLEGDQHGTRS